MRWQPTESSGEEHSRTWDGLCRASCMAKGQQSCQANWLTQEGEDWWKVTAVSHWKETTPAASLRGHTQCCTWSMQEDKGSISVLGRTQWLWQPRDSRMRVRNGERLEQFTVRIVHVGCPLLRFCSGEIGHQRLLMPFGPPFPPARLKSYRKLLF